MIILLVLEARCGFCGPDRGTPCLFPRSHSPDEEFGDGALTVTSSRRSERNGSCCGRWCQKIDDALDGERQSCRVFGLPHASFAARTELLDAAESGSFLGRFGCEWPPTSLERRPQ